MLPEGLLKTTNEVLRRCQDLSSPADVAERLCMLLRVTALTSPEPRAAVSEVHDKLRPFIADAHVLEAVAARVQELLVGDAPRAALEAELDALLEEVRDAEAELAEQTAGVLGSGDVAVVLGEAEGGFMEAALRDAGETLADAGARGLTVRVVRVAPDPGCVADGLAGRLRGVRGLDVEAVQDSDVTRALVGASKVVVVAEALDAEDGALCGRGAGLLAAAANRMRVPLVVVVPRHRLLAGGGSVVSVMGLAAAAPGPVWCYEEARADRKHAAVGVVAHRFDVVAPVEKIDMVVTEFGGYAPKYVKMLTPKLEGNGHGEMQE